jgi:hypothetical protein
MVDCVDESELEEKSISTPIGNVHNCAAVTPLIIPITLV